MAPQKRKIVVLSVKQIFEIIQELSKGKKQAEIVIEREVSRSVVSRIWQNRVLIEKQFSIIFDIKTSILKNHVATSSQAKITNFFKS